MGGALRLLDLRFSDPKVERLYYNYYAQVKRNLLPTAIQVVLLVNLLQLLATCLHLYWIETITVSLCLQVGILIGTFALLRAVRAELNPANRRRFSSAAGRLHPSSSSSSLSSSTSDAEETSLKVRVTKRGDHAKPSLSVEIEGHRHHQADEEFSNSSCSSASENEQEEEAAAAAAAEDAGDAKDVEMRLREGASGSSSKQSKQRHTRHRRRGRRRPRRKGLSRYKLSLPYLLWLCQLVQLASGLWPQQSFITYATLLLYSYTIYVIFPIRLMNCILLALGLATSQPLLDHLLLASLRQAFEQAPTTTAPFLASKHLQDSEQQPVWKQQQLKTASDLSTMSNETTFGSSGGSHRAASLVGGGTVDNSLLIPMTSHLAKLVAFAMLALGINIIGIMSFFFYERQQRVAFLETRQSLETKQILEEESQEQERLLLSILPKHLASEIRQDLGAVVGGQFKKIYMSRHENVSILFADIVGFTAISSHCPAAELVKILNELFARFDKLAEKYHQLRIKILGDCYYAISGAPQERPDHAVLCVHMGLSMVEAIKSVREKTKSGVDMRVGIHTGGVLAGVLGQRQWQFDVYSKDVELANKMESSGAPGRVHISHATLRFLNDEFQVSPADGAAREESLRLAGLQTYFIDHVKKPYPEGTLDAVQSTTTESLKRQSPAKVVAHNHEPAPSPHQRLKTGSGKQQTGSKAKGKSRSLEGACGGNGGSGSKKARNDSFNLEQQIRLLTLNFTNRHFERQFRSTSDIASCVSLIGLPITLLSAFLAHLYLYRPQTDISLVYASCCALLLLMVLVCILPYLWARNGSSSSATGATSIGGTQIAATNLGSSSSAPSPAHTHVMAPIEPKERQCLVRSLVLVADKVKQSAWMKLTLTGLMTSIWFLAHSLACQMTTARLGELAPSPLIRLFAVDLFNYFAIACSLAITAVTRISFLLKTAIILAVILLQVILNLTLLSQLLAERLGGLPTSSPASASPTSTSNLNHLGAAYDQYIFTLTLATICWALILINRQFEITNRRLFLWRKQVEVRKEKVADMREKNEMLVYNILPPNVAKIFLGKRSLGDEELYSKSYDAVGVLFAAMPNFSDFYTEESVNNQGLECLRFLNEVISDYDALLDQPRFKNIIKIKSMGSTYMAASGLYEGDALTEGAANGSGATIITNGNGGNSNSNENGNDDDDISRKWGHLEQLTEFALALKETLNNINKESFNNFVLRIGINQGPITAGVIGVKKPHFDMWGNTVNVASRMESTGRAGSVQVVEETATILRHFGFEFDQRGLVSVKGKGKLMTFYLTGRALQQQQHRLQKRQALAPQSNAGVAATVAST